MCILTSWEIDRAVKVFATDLDVYPAAKYLADFRDIIEQHSKVKWIHFATGLTVANMLIVIVRSALRNYDNPYARYRKPHRDLVIRACNKVTNYLTTQEEFVKKKVKPPKIEDAVQLTFWEPPHTKVGD